MHDVIHFTEYVGKLQFRTKHFGMHLIFGMMTFAVGYVLVGE